MKSIRFMILALLCAVAQGAWAQTTVSTDQELRDAIADKAIIKLTSGIELSNKTLSIPEGTTVTIDLGGHTLDRRLTQRGEGGGQVITVRSGATLNLSNGTLKGGWGGDSGGINNEGGTANLTDVTITGCTGDDRGGGIVNRTGSTLNMTGGSITNNVSRDNTGIPAGGGGIFNASGATATLTNVTITGNETKVYGGGGIDNFGTLTLNGCTITGNTSKANGAGIWTSAGSTLNMLGKMTVADNAASESVASNLFLSDGAVITVTGSLAGSSIGVTMQTVGVFTSGYNTHNSGVDPANVFTSDETVFYVMRTADETGLALDYVECSWDDESKVVKSETKTLANGNYTVLKGGGDIDLQPGYYIVKSNVTYGTLNMAGNGVHHLILCDGARIKANFVHIIDDDVLHIYGQTNSTGQLRVDNPLDNHAGLGSGPDEDVGTIVIHGGDISVHSGDGGSAGIGSSNHSSGGPVSSWRVPRHRSNLSSADDGTITIYDGTVKAYGGTNGSGIGGGRHSRSGTITINGGKVYAYGGDDAAGIGGGWDTSGYSLVVNGGYVEAHGGGNGAGIGSGSVQITNGTNVVGGEVTINGGEVYAYGGVDAAGIGGGEDANGGTVTITGGYVYAEGNDYGPGIGGGQDGKGANVTITGGTVIAKAGRQARPEVETENRAIGPGEGCDDYGKLTIGDNMMVQAGYDGDNYEPTFTAGLRVPACWYRSSARIEPCTHASLTYTVSGTEEGDTHTAHCKYCTTEFAPEQHTFSNGVCTVCGVESTTTLYTVRTYLPQKVSEAYDGETYRCQTSQMASGTAFTMPDCPTTVPGLEFVGWEVSDVTAAPYTSAYTTTGGTIQNAGDEYTISGDVSFIARYQNLDITLVDNATNGEVLSAHDGMTTHSVTLSGRTLYKDGGWNTLCLPFNATLTGDLADATLMELDVDGWYEGNTRYTEEAEGRRQTGFENGTLYLNFKTASSIVAGKPYIIKWVSGDNITSPEFSNVTISNSVTEVVSADGTLAFVGSYSPHAYTEENRSILFMGGGSSLYYPDGKEDITIGSCRAHFRLKGIEAGDPAAGVKAFVLNFEEEDDATSINRPTPDPSRNGGEVYDLAGRKVQGARSKGQEDSSLFILHSSLKKGIYIVNGKKILK